MNHKKIQKKFLLYIDGDLSEDEKLLIDQHLDECSTCKQHFEDLANIWNEERKLEQPSPSTALWHSIKDRMEKKAAEKFSVMGVFGNVKIMLNTAIIVAVFAAAVFVGSKFGSLLYPYNSIQNDTYAYSENIWDEFGMNYFEVIPPNSIAKDIFVTPANDKGLQK